MIRPLDDKASSNPRTVMNRTCQSASPHSSTPQMTTISKTHLAADTLGDLSTSNPPSPVLATSRRCGSSVRFSSDHSDSTGGRSSLSSPNMGASRPAILARASPSATAFSSAVKYRRTVSGQSTHGNRHLYPSTKLRGKIEKPWVKYPDPAHRWAKAIFWGLVGLGFVVGAVGEYQLSSRGGSKLILQ